MSSTVRISQEYYDRLVMYAERENRSVTAQLTSVLDDYYSGNKKESENLELEYIIQTVDEIKELLQSTPQIKETSNPQKSSGLKPIRSKSLVQSELWAAEKKLKNVVQEVQDISIEESLADEEAERYGEALKEEYRAEIEKLQYELSGMEG